MNRHEQLKWWLIRRWPWGYRLASQIELQLFNRGYLQLMTRPRNYRKAIEDFSEALGLAPTYGDAYFYRAVAYHDQKRFEDALQDLRQAFGLRDSTAAAQLCDMHLIRAHCHYGRGEWQEALNAYRKYVELAPIGHGSVNKARAHMKECQQRLTTGRR